jgi:Short-chain dehydrogenases of various substrate specificities
MSEALVWISGGSGGIGRALAAAVPWDGARVIDISRRGSPDLEHVEADLSDSASWGTVAQSFERELRAFSGDVVVFIHAAGTLEPMGFAGEVDSDSYARNVVLNSAAPQTLGHGFLAAAREVDARRHLVMLTSGCGKQRLRRLVVLRRGQGRRRSMGAQRRGRAGRARRRPGDLGHPGHGGHRHAGAYP